MFTEETREIFISQTRAYSFNLSVEYRSVIGKNKNVKMK